MNRIRDALMLYRIFRQRLSTLEALRSAWMVARD